ncbi:hypothetical protein B0H13DRAFT_1610682, partial [Mycena leptocephala]
GKLINSRGDVICIAWQRTLGCSLNHAARHECSGCGSPNHGAQKCHLAQAM